MASPTTRVKAPQAEELLLFAQILQSARASGVPLSRFLADAGASLPAGRAAEWSVRLGEGLAQGKSPAEALNGLSDLDEVLAALLSIPGGLGLREVLTAYVRHLVSVVRLDEHLRAALFHPFLILWLSVANIVLVNLHLFPQMAASFADKGRSLPLLVQVWYIAAPHTWPISCLLPAGVLALAVMATRLLFFRQPHQTSGDAFGRLLGMDRFVRDEEQGRLLGILALFLEAGRPLPQALRWTARHGGAHQFQTELFRAADRIEQGMPAPEAFSLGPTLEPLSLGWMEEGAETQIVNRLKYLSEAHLQAANRLVGTIETFGSLIGLMLIGTLVLLLCLAFFQPYWTLVGQG